MRTWILAAVALVAAAAIWRASTNLEVVADRLAVIVRPVEQRTMQTLKTTWTLARGTEEVVTTKAESESGDVFQARHDAAVATAQALHPPK